MGEYSVNVGKVALVTGGSGHIGRAIALRLGAMGFSVGVGYHRNLAGAEETAERLRERHVACCTVPADLGSEQGPRALVAAVEEALGPIDVLINCAGAELYGLAVETDYAELRRVIDVNLLGAYLCAQRVLPGMTGRRWGRIVNVGSIWGEVGAAYEAAYSASKAGLTGLTKALAKEVALSGVTVNAVAAGVIDTPMLDGFSAEEKEALRLRVGLGRLGTGEDVAGAVAFLVSEDAAYVTGHVLWVTGGFDPLPS